MGKRLNVKKKFIWFHNLHNETFKLALLLGVLIALVFLNFNKEITAFLGSQSKQEEKIESFTYPVQIQVEDTPTEIPSPTPAPTFVPIPTTIPNIVCNIGAISLEIPQSVCDKANIIQGMRQHDAEATQRKINDLINQVKPYLDQFSEVANISCAFYGFSSPDLNTQAMSSCLNSNQQLMQSIQVIINSYNAKIAWYRNYLSGIQNGVGSGACSDHGGVSCSTARTDIGQVVCNDGWRNSEVHYFNVKECVNYFLLKED